MENVDEDTWSHLAGCKIPIDTDRVDETARAILKARNASVMHGFLIYLKSVPSVSLPDAIMEQAVKRMRRRSFVSTAHHKVFITKISI